VGRNFHFEIGKKGFWFNAYSSAVDKKTAPTKSETFKVYAPAGMSAKAWCLYQGLYNDPEKTQLRHEKSC
jgi:hypothetical protein